MELNNLKVTNKNILLFGILFLILPNISAMIINEIMYNPPSQDSYAEWIELYNNDGSDIDLSDWGLCDKNLSGGYLDHADSQIKNDAGLILSAGGYAVITDGGTGTEVYQNSAVNPDSLALHVDASTLCGGGAGLTNTGETITLKDSSGNLINSVTYDSSLANNNGNSLQICSNSWTEKSPTPGSANLCAEEIVNNTSVSNNSNSEASQNESTAPTIEVNYPLKASLNKEFIFKIKLINFVQDNYDVKIEIFSNGDRIAEIMNNNQWKSTTYYLNEIINSGEKEFTMRVVKEFENAEIIIKIKNSNEKIETFQGYNISINSEETNKTYNGTASEIIYLNASLTNQQNYQNENNKINISTENTNSKDIKSEENKSKLDKSNYAKYILTAFVFLLALLFLLKKIFKKKYQNEFKN